MTETSNKKFEINIVVLGCESTGKTTVVNALCGGEYSEANYGRTTEGINIFRLSELPPLTGQDVICVEDEDAKRSRLPDSHEPRSNKRSRTLESTFNKIKENNEALRESSERGQESTFDIVLNELPITMRNDAQLIITESPGLNKSKDTNQEARTYIEEQWDTFDAAVLVMDARQSVDYDDQMENLSFVRNLWSDKKDIPIFILCNKVDDPENLGGEEEHKLKAVRSKVQDEWKVDCRERALEQLILPGCSKFEPVFPVFVPTSAKTAYLLRAGSAMSNNEFSNKMPVEYFHSIGQQEFGKKWRNMSEQDKHESIHGLLLSPEYRKELLRMSGFDKLLKALEICVGGDQAQLAMIRRNFNRDLELCDFRACDMPSKLRSMNEQRQTLGEPTESLKAKFWDSFPEWANPAVDTFDKYYKPDDLAIPAQKLVQYQRFCIQEDWVGEIEKVQQAFGTLVRRMLATINKRANDCEWAIDCCLREGQLVDSWSWSSLSPVDWVNIISSVLLLRCKEAFCRKFGRAIICLERVSTVFSHKALHACGMPECDEDAAACEHQEPIMGLAGADPDKSLKEIIPESFEDSPGHYAHVGWLFCEAEAESKEYLKSRA